MMKKLLISCFMGIGIALSIFNATGMVFDLANDGIFQFQNYQYTKMMLGSIVIGIGFGLPSLIYENDKVPYVLQVVFHMGIGCTVMLITAFLVGWLPTDIGVPAIIFAVLGQLGLSFLIWRCFVCYYKKETAIINKKIKSMNDQI